MKLGMEWVVGLEGAWSCLTKSGRHLHLGRRFHLAESSEGGIFQVERAPSCVCGIKWRHLYLGVPFSFDWELRRRHFWFRGRSVVVADLRGGIRIWGRRFQVQSPWLGSSEGGIFQV